MIKYPDTEAGARQLVTEEMIKSAAAVMLETGRFIPDPHVTGVWGWESPDGRVRAGPCCTCTRVTSKSTTTGLRSRAEALFAGPVRLYN